MIKILTLFALLASSLASQGWVGSWFTDRIESNDYSDCDVPGYLDVSNITLNSDNTLNLNSEQAYSSHAKNWTLKWEANATDTHFCQEDGMCVNGTLVKVNGILSATITWYNTSNNFWCSSILTPAKAVWTGEWLVYDSQQNHNCPVPKNPSQVHITSYEDVLLMTGTDNSTGLVSTWTLNFPEADRNGYGCIESVYGNLCASGKLGIVGYLMYGNITWTADNSWQCTATLVNLVSDYDDDVSDKPEGADSSESEGSDFYNSFNW